MLAVVIEAFHNVPNDLQLLLLGEVKLFKNFRFSPNSLGTWQCVKFVLFCARLKILHTLEVHANKPQPILVVHLNDLGVQGLNGVSMIDKTGWGQPLG